MFFSAKNRSGRRRSDRHRAQPAAERLEPRALMTVSPGTEFSRPAGFAQAAEPTAYFDVATGVLQFDPVGHNVNIVIFTYNTEVANITGSTPGPFVYPSGTLQNAVSTSAEKKTFPAGTWGLVPTTFPARLAGGITLTNTPSLATTGANSASTNGWFNKPWSFGAVVAPNALSIAEAERNFISSTTTTDIGYGPGRDLFQYAEFGVTGNHYGRVVVYATPDPASKPNSILGMAGDEIAVSRSTGSSFTTATLASLPAGTTWVNSVSGDFDGDNRTDIATQTDTGAWWVTTNPASGTPMPQQWGSVAAYQFATVGDFNGDKKSDIAVRNSNNGAWQVLTSTGSGFTPSRFGRWNPAVTWSNVLAGDFNNDGRDDIVGQRSDGQLIVAASTGTAFSSSLWATLKIGQVGTVGDYNADGRDDLALWNSTTGKVRVLTSSGTAFVPKKFGSWDPTTTWSNIRPGDFNGDGRTDLLAQRADGTWFVSVSNGLAFSTSAWAALPSGQFATVGDFNFDDLDDVAVRSSTGGIWRVMTSSGSAFTSSKFGSWRTAKAWSRAFAARA